MDCPRVVQVFGWTHTPDGLRWGGRYLVRLPEYTYRVRADQRIVEDDWENQPGSDVLWVWRALERAVATVLRSTQRKVERHGEAFDVAAMEWVIEVVPEGADPDARVPTERAA